MTVNKIVINNWKYVDKTKRELDDFMRAIFNNIHELLQHDNNS